MNTRLAYQISAAVIGLASFALVAPGCMGAQESDTGEQVDENGDAISGPVCLGSQAGAYCGNDSMSGAVASTLYQCPGANQSPTSSQACAGGCVVAPAGQADYCGAATPKCLASQAGAYCGNDAMSGAVASTLYQCPGANLAPTSSQACAGGCVVAPAGQADYCGSSGGGGYKLPWHAGTSMSLTQDCNDSCCSDHIGSDKYAWDFADGGSFAVVAARGGTVTHVKINSTTGCGSSSCANNANFIVIDHGDGTQSTYLHLQGWTLDASISCGAHVNQGQRLATAGTTGWSTGIHLHYEVSKTHPGAATCECGPTGQACATNYVPWANFWSSATYPTVAATFSEWPAASTCGNRRITMPASTN